MIQMSHAPLSSRFATLSVLCALLCTLTACNNEPDREWATETYASEKASIEQVHKELQVAFEAFAPVPYQEHPKDPAARTEFVKAQDARRDVFDAAAVKILGAHDKIIGWEITYSFPKIEKPPIPYSFEETSRHVPAWKPGTVRAEKREAIDGRKVSWGEFFIKGQEKRESLGMDIPNYHWGLEVMLPIAHEKAKLDTSIFIVPKRNDEE